MLNVKLLMKESIDNITFSKNKKQKIQNLLNKDFRSDQIRFVSKDVELVRNKFVYKKIEYQDISEIRFTNGYLIKNRWLSTMSLQKIEKKYYLINENLKD